MPEEHDESADLAKLTSNIHEAMTAYKEFQMELSAALSPWQEQWSALQENLSPLFSAIEPLQKDIIEAAVQWCSIQESWREHASAIQDAAARWAGAWAEAQQAIARELAAIGPRLRETFKRADHVGRLGWTVTMKMMPSDILMLSEVGVPAEANVYMLEWYAEVDPLLEGVEQRILETEQLAEFRTSLAQCFSAYRRGEYAISVPLLVAVLERSIRIFLPAERFFTTDMHRVVKGHYEKVNHASPETIEAFCWLSLNSFVHWLYQQYGPRDVGENRIFRHGIQHGTQPPPNEKIEVIRLVHALDTVLTLHRRWH